MVGRRWILRISGFLLLTSGVLPLGGPASSAAENYPRLAQYVCRVGEMTQAQLDTLARYDLVLLYDRPSTLAEIRQRNPDIRLYFSWLPQNIMGLNEDETFWHPDTSWNLNRLCQYYARQNDWYLRDTSGERIPEWAGYAANWTRYCPPGTYGTSMGLTYVEWLIQVAIPQIVGGGNGVWDPWVEGNGSSYDGIMLEVLVDCVGSWYREEYERADPDRDGEAEGCYSACSQGGDADSLSILYREMNEVFHAAISQIQDQGTSVLLHAGNPHVGPGWRTDVAGLKLEAWMSGFTPEWQDWWDHFYGLRDWADEQVWGPGYRWAEDFVGHSGIDDKEGWDRTILEVVPRPNWPTHQKDRVRRWGLGTALLGDGFFCYTPDECNLHWKPEYEWSFGEPVDDYVREVFGADTLYVRLFTLGSVEVNPHDHTVQGIPGQDSRFGFWQTVDDLRAVAMGQTQVNVTFTAPPQTPSPVEGSELRFARFPVTTDSWDQATPYSGNPIHAGAGAPVSLIVDNLVPGNVYHFALRNRVYGRLEPGISNLTRAFTWSDQPDTLPPSRVIDLRVITGTTTTLDLEWTAPADSVTGATVAAYSMAWRAGGPIVTEADWEAANLVESGLPEPAYPGEVEAFRLQGLEPSTVYGIAIRALDEAQLLGPISNPLQGETAAGPHDPGDPSGPPSVEDLRFVGAGMQTAVIALRHPDRFPGQSEPVQYAAGFSTEPFDLARWSSLPHPSGAPPPGTAGEEAHWMIEGLSPDTLYYLAVRAVDAAGRWSPLSPLLSFRTTFQDAAPPDPPGRPTILWNPDGGTATVAWPPSGDPRTVGYRLYLGWQDGSWHRAEDRILETSHYEGLIPEPTRDRRVAVRSVALDGLESPLSPPAELYETGWKVEGPYPQPVTDQCRVVIHIPADGPIISDLRVEIFALGGESVAPLYQGPAAPGARLDLHWNRIARGGQRAAPGFYYLIVEGGGRRDLRTIYLAP